MLRSRFVRGLACLLTALLLITAMPARSLAASVYNVRVTKNYTYIYRTASTSSAHLKKVTKDTVLVCGAAKGSWAYVKYNGVIGYVRTSDIKVENASSSNTSKTVESDGATEQATENTATAPTTDTSSSSTTGQTTVRSTTSLRLYKSASTSAAYYGTIAKNKTFICLSIDGKWAQVQVGKYTGYVLSGGLITISASTPSSSTSSSSSSTSSAAAETVDPSTVKGVTCYVKTSTDLCLSASTSSGSVCSVQIGDKIIVTHVKSGWCRAVTEQGKVGYLPISAVSKTKIYVNGNIVLADWFTSDIQGVFKVGTQAVVTDVLTRQTFQIRRRGGLYHADCEPLTKADTATILALYGGAVSWNRRAIWVTVGNVTYAASMNFMNHGEQTIYDNGFAGHFCIHFYNSRTHGTNNVDPDHQAAVLAAFKTKP